MKLAILLLSIGIASANTKIFDLNYLPTEVDDYLKSGFFKGYFTAKEFWNFIKDITLKPENKKLVSGKVLLGHTINNNPIYGFYICDDVSQLSTYLETKNILMFTALHHSREPLSLTMVIYMVIEMLKDFKSDSHSKMKELLRDNVIFIVPTLNIDSYLYITNMYREHRATEEVLMIRKNRNLDRSCDPMHGGVDLNRNYGYKFGVDDVGSSNKPCEEDYRGPAPFSEKETQAIKRYVETHKNIVSCVNIHTYGNAWIYPFNYVHDGADHYLAVKEPLFFDFFKEFEKEMDAKGRKSHYGNSAFIMDYPANGEAGDWLTGAKHILNLDVELGTPDKESDKFYPPKALIPKIVRYNWKTMRDFLSKHVVVLDLLHLYLERGNKTRVIFEIFNKAISNLKDAVFHVKPLFVNNEDIHYDMEWGVKALPEEVIKKENVKRNQFPLTFRGRHILEVDVSLSNEIEEEKLVGLELVIQRNEGNYLFYPNQKYIFKIKHPERDH